MAIFNSYVKLPARGYGFFNTMVIVHGKIVLIGISLYSW